MTLLQHPQLVPRMVEHFERERAPSREHQTYLDHWSTPWPSLTIHQPWASLIMGQYKLVENRTWRTNYRGPLIIHAGMNRKLLDTVPQLRAEGYNLPDPLPLGSVLGVVLLTECEPINALPPRWIDDPFAEGPFGWCLSGVIPLATPLTLSGKQGLFRPGEDVQSAVRAAVELYFGM